MRHKIYITLAMSMIMLFMPVWLRAQKGPDTDIREKRLTDVDIAAPNLHRALSRISAQYGIPIGIEVCKGGNSGPEIKLQRKSATVREVVNAIVKIDGRYQWSLEGKVINVVPISGRDISLQHVLDTKVKRFSIPENMTTFDLRAEIMKLPEVKTALDSQGLAPKVRAYTSADEASLGDRFTLRMSNVTLKDILNEIIGNRDSEAKSWVVTTFSEPIDYFIVNFSIYEGPPIEKPAAHSY